MTSILATVNPSLIVDDDLAAAGYTQKEITLIGYCWQDAQQVSKSKMALAQHLYELKQEMDGNDPSKGAGNNGKSRFWAAFDAGHLPFAGDKGRTTVATSITAAEWLHARESFNPLNNSFSNLAPSTVYEISRLESRALELVEHHLKQTDFIGVAAVRLLANEAKGEVFDRLFDWVKQNPAKVLTPKTIRAVKAQVDEANKPAATATVDIGPILQGIRAEAPQREHHARVQSVKEQLSKPDREHQQLLDSQIQAYSKALTTASTAVHELFAYMRQLSNVHGTELLDEMRATDYRGFVTVADDMQRLQAIGKELMEVVQLAQTSNPPTGIDMTTVNV